MGNDEVGPSVAFVGCGKVAYFHADVLADLGVRIQAVCGSSANSRSAKSFAARYSVPRIYASHRELLSEDDADFLWVVTSWNVTESLLIDLLIDGRPALVEKPIATSSKKIEQVLSFVDSEISGKCSLFCAMNRRYYDFIPQLQDAIEPRADIRSASVIISEQTRISEPTDAVEAERLRNLWVNSAIHEIDLMLYLLGDLEVVRVYRSRDRHTGSVTSVNALLESIEYGFPVFLAANWDSSENKSLLVETSDKTVKLSPIERMTISEGMVRVPPTETNPIARYSPRVLADATASTRFKPGFYEQARSFMAMASSDTFADRCRTSLTQFESALMLIERLLTERTGPK